MRLKLVSAENCLAKMEHTIEIQSDMYRVHYILWFCNLSKRGQNFTKIFGGCATQRFGHMNPWKIEIKIDKVPSSKLVQMPSRKALNFTEYRELVHRYRDLCRWYVNCRLQHAIFFGVDPCSIRCHSCFFSHFLVICPRRIRAAAPHVVGRHAIRACHPCHTTV